MPPVFQAIITPPNGLHQTHEEQALSLLILNEKDEEEVEEAEVYWNGWSLLHMALVEARLPLSDWSQDRM